MTQIKKIDKIWGTEEWIVNNELYCGKILRIKDRFRCSLHSHKKKTETFYILKGQVLLELENNAYMLLPGDAIDVLPNEKHRFTGLMDSEIIEFSTHHEDKDSYRSSKNEKVKTGQIEELNRKIALTRKNNERVRRVKEHGI